MFQEIKNWSWKRSGLLQEDSCSAEEALVILGSSRTLPVLLLPSHPLYKEPWCLILTRTRICPNFKFPWFPQAVIASLPVYHLPKPLKTYVLHRLERLKPWARCSSLSACIGGQGLYLIQEWWHWIHTTDEPIWTTSFHMQSPPFAEAAAFVLMIEGQKEVWHVQNPCGTTNLLFQTWHDARQRFPYVSFYGREPTVDAMRSESFKLQHVSCSLPLTSHYCACCFFDWPDKWTEQGGYIGSWYLVSML